MMESEHIFLANLLLHEVHCVRAKTHYEVKTYYSFLSKGTLNICNTKFFRGNASHRASWSLSKAQTRAKRADVNS